MKLICAIIGVYRSLRFAYWFGPGDDTVSGHDYVEQDDGALRCARCGEVS